MSRTLRKTNIRVEVYPRSEGDFGSVYIGGVGTPASNERHELREAERILSETRRHVDSIAHAVVNYDLETVCSTNTDVVDDEGDARNKWPACCDTDQYNFFVEHKYESDQWFVDHGCDDLGYLAEFREGHHVPVAEEGAP